MVSEQQTPAGWYPDPGNSSRQRYWDGAQWTEQVSPPDAMSADEAAAYRSRGKRRAVIILGATGLLVAAGWVAIANGWLDQSAEQTSLNPTAGPAVPGEFEVNVTSSKVGDSDSLTVLALVKNVGKKAQGAECLAVASEPTGTYGAQENYNLGRIKPGEWRLLRADLTVSNDGAAKVTDIAVRCS